MSNLPTEERIAALLGSLGRDVSETILADLPDDASGRLRKLLDRFEEIPLDEVELEEVLEEFTRLFRFAVHEVQDDGSRIKGSGDEPAPVSQGESPESSSAEEPPPFTPSEDPFADLERLQPFQVAGALKDEGPRTIALVLNCLSPPKAGKALQTLPESVRSQVFLMLRDPPKAPDGLLRRIVRTTVEKGCTLAMEAVSDPQQERNRKLAALLRVMGQSERVQMLRMLEEQDEECVTQIRRLLYTFDDLPGITDRSIQKILSETDSTTLATALKNSDESALQKVMNNLSRRARATLTEEIDFLTHIKPEDQREARQAICDIMARLDQSGDLETV